MNTNTDQQKEKSYGFGYFFILFIAFIVGFLGLAKAIMWLLK